MTDPLKVSNALAPTKPASAGTPFEAMDSARALAQQLIDSGEFIPSALRKQGAGGVCAALLTGRELGLPDMVTLRNLYVYEGKVGLDYKIQLALLKQAGYRISWPERTMESVTLKLVSPEGDEHVETYDKAEAERAELWNRGDKAWKRHPKRMLTARCVTGAIACFCPEVTMGLYGADEIESLREESWPERDENLTEEQRASLIVSQLRSLGAEVPFDSLAYTQEELELQLWRGVRRLVPRFQEQLQADSAKRLVMSEICRLAEGLDLSLLQAEPRELAAKWCHSDPPLVPPSAAKAERENPTGPLFDGPPVDDIGDDEPSPVGEVLDMEGRGEKTGPEEGDDVEG